MTSRYATLRPAQQLPGLIAPYQNVAIQSTLSEPADEVTVREGDSVFAGETLARLDTADLEAQLQADLAQAHSDAANATHTVFQGALTIAQSSEAVNSSNAAVREAQSTLAKDTLDLDRYRQLGSQGYVSQQQVAQQAALVRNDQQAVRGAQAQLTSSQEAVLANGTLQGNGLQSSSVEQARATQQVALAQALQVRTSIAKATIVSPIDGVVVNRNFNPGEYPGTRQLFTLQQTRPIYAVLRGSGAQIARIRTGARASIAASDVGRAAQPGVVEGVLNQINPGSTDFEVKVLLQNPAGTLRPGMPVVGTVDLPAVRGIEVPTTAFTDDAHASLLVVGSSNTVKTLHVAETVDDGKHALVTGLAAGQRVIADGQTSVADGQKVAAQKVAAR